MKTLLLLLISSIAYSQDSVSVKVKSWDRINDSTIRYKVKVEGLPGVHFMTCCCQPKPKGYLSMVAKEDLFPE
jgi:hypothetical protein